MAVASDRIEALTDTTGSRPAPAAIDFDEYVARVSALADSCCEDTMPARVGRELRALLLGTGWLPRECCRPGEDTYRRHLLYADPEGRFTILSVVWRPGQSTPVHGHTAWGAVGVYRGTPGVSNYRLHRERGLEMVCDATCSAGDISCVRAGIDYPHRVYNAGADIAITIHTYGRDLVDDPGAINIPV